MKQSSLKLIKYSQYKNVAMYIYDLYLSIFTKYVFYSILNSNSFLL